MKLRIAGINDDSIVDGDGVRLTVFTQGCLHHCPGCQNPETHAVAGGYIIDTDDILNNSNYNNNSIINNSRNINRNRK